MKYAFDTNIIVALIRGKESTLHSRYLAGRPQDYFVPEMVRAELLFGAMLSAYPSKNIAVVENFLQPLQLLPFSNEATFYYAEIRLHLHRLGQPIGPNDLIIAATARANNMVLLTRNIKEFLRVPELVCEEW
ncbi:MAG TPA: type II toxin-antitoxin system VapC family toxin [Chthoniobacterales bacterium]|nr:type II toxin-antitoxin system VapC family toxin [Chthoniobacterales bacterium]